MGAFSHLYSLRNFVTFSLFHCSKFQILFCDGDFFRIFNFSRIHICPVSFPYFRVHTIIFCLFQFYFYLFSHVDIFHFFHIFMCSQFHVRFFRFLYLYIAILTCLDIRISLFSMFSNVHISFFFTFHVLTYFICSNLHVFDLSRFSHFTLISFLISFQCLFYFVIDTSSCNICYL